MARPPPHPPAAPGVPEPPVVFSPWTPWAARETLRDAHLPGVYLLALFPAGPPPRVDPQDDAILYIGEISDNSLLGRWHQFARAAFNGTPGHAGGMVYHAEIGAPEQELYVAAFVPQGLSRELRALYIRYVERRLVWEYARGHDVPPRCNRR